jgi:myxalamid-type polyketide synthase MxaE and MxaD
MPQIRSAAEIEAWLIAYIAELAGLPLTEIGVDDEFISLGMSSAEAVILTGDIQTWLGIVLDPTLAWEHPTIRASAIEIARQLAGKHRTSGRATHSDSC